MCSQRCQSTERCLQSSATLVKLHAPRLICPTRKPERWHTQCECNHKLRLKHHQQGAFVKSCQTCLCLPLLSPH